MQKQAITNEKIKALRHPNRERNNTHRQRWAEAVRRHKIGVKRAIDAIRNLMPKEIREVPFL